MSHAGAQEDNPDLTAFRQAWKAELQRQGGSVASPDDSRPLHDASRIGKSAEGVPFVPERPFKSTEDLAVDATAVECYAAAIEAERRARLDEATRLYRRAFRLDPDVEKAYLTYSAVRTDTESKISEEKDSLAFEFSRTVQIGGDYVDPKGDRFTHPSSTSALQQRVLNFIRETPFVREGSEGQKLALEEQQVYHQADVTLPIAFAKLPSECVVQILMHLVIPQQEERYPHLEDLEVGFARICRRSRLDSLEPDLWRSICERVYRYPQIPADETVARLVRRHGMDWRRMYLSQPRLRTDGCFIGVQRYVRRGHQESAWVSPSYSVTYYRFLRLFADGRCVSLQTTIEPGAIVRQLHPDLRITGLLIGGWTLALNGILRCKLEDPALPRDKRKYSFELDARLKSTARGRMNKLEILRLATCRQETLEVEELPLGESHARPYYFSKVAFHF